MKKIFTLCAAVLVALAVQSEPIAPGTGALSAAIGAAEPGAVIELASGDFTESSSIGLSKNLTIKAADGASPVVKAIFGIQGGATVTFEGIKFDASIAEDHLIYANDATAGNKLICEGCEFYDYTPTSSLIHISASKTLDACTINNCYIHNINKSFIFNENTSNAFDLTVSNSTIANVTTASSYYAGVIDSRATSGTVRVNQCTFYNVQVINTDYAAVGKISAPGAIVSNSIFSMPTSTDNLRAIRDVSAANNCLTYNYTKDSNRGIHSDVAKNNCIYGQDPLFADAANGDFSLAETSPAHEAGVGGTHLGDPRWWPASWQPASIVEVTSVELDKDVLSVEVDDVELLTATVSPDDATDPSVSWSSNATANATVSAGLVSGIAAGSATITATAGEKSATCAVTVTAAVVPDVDFSAPCVLMGRKAHLEGAIWKMYKDDTYKLYGEGGSNKNYGTASWTINVTHPCVVSGVLNGVEGGHLYELDLYSGDDLLGYIAHPAAKAWSSSSPLAMDSTDHSTLTFPVAGQYKLVLRNNQEWSSGKVENITLTYEGELPAPAPVEELEIEFTADPYVVLVPTSGTLPDGVVVTGSFHDAQHGYSSPKVTIPVLAGNYKITIGNCIHSNNDGASIKNADESATLNMINANGQTITSILAKDNCYHQDPTNNFTCVWFVADADQTINVLCPQYTPYFKIEKVDAVPEAKTMYTVSFSAGDAQGVAPAAIEVEAGHAITIPVNRSLYKEGKTLFCWTDGANYYATNTDYQPAGDVELEPIFNDNTVELLNATEEVTVKWMFSKSNGAPSLSLQNGHGNGLIVTQATVGGEKIDVKLDIDANTGKFDNAGRTDEWAQVNANTYFVFPAKTNAVVTTRCYGEPTNSTVDAAAYTAWESNVATYAVNPTEGVSQLANGANTYYSYLQIVLPATATGINNTDAEIKAIKRIENGVLVIEKNGVKYNAQGAELR